MWPFWIIPLIGWIIWLILFFSYIKLFIRAYNRLKWFSFWIHSLFTIFFILFGIGFLTFLWWFSKEAFFCRCSWDDAIGVVWLFLYFLFSSIVDIIVIILTYFFKKSLLKKLKTSTEDFKDSEKKDNIVLVKIFLILLVGLFIILWIYLYKLFFISLYNFEVDGWIVFIFLVLLSLFLLFLDVFIFFLVDYKFKELVFFISVFASVFLNLYLFGKFRLLHVNLDINVYLLSVLFIILFWVIFLNLFYYLKFFRQKVLNVIVIPFILLSLILLKLFFIWGKYLDTSIQKIKNDLVRESKKLEGIVSLTCSKDKYLNYFLCNDKFFKFFYERFNYNVKYSKYRNRLVYEVLKSVFKDNYEVVIVSKWYIFWSRYLLWYNKEWKLFFILPDWQIVTNFSKIDFRNLFEELKDKEIQEFVNGLELKLKKCSNQIWKWKKVMLICKKDVWDYLQEVLSKVSKWWGAYKSDFLVKVMYSFNNNISELYIIVKQGQCNWKIFYFERKWGTYLNEIKFNNCKKLNNLLKLFHLKSDAFNSGIFDTEKLRLNLWLQFILTKNEYKLCRFYVWTGIYESDKSWFNYYKLSNIVHKLFINSESYKNCFFILGDKFLTDNKVYLSNLEMCLINKIEKYFKVQPYISPHEVKNFMNECINRLNSKLKTNFSLDDFYLFVSKFLGELKVKNKYKDVFDVYEISEVR